MGLFDKRRPQQEQMPGPTWEADRARIASFLYRARTFNGTGPEDPTLAVTLRPGERALLVATGTYLVEPRRVQAHWAGTEGGFTFHVVPRSASTTRSPAVVVGPPPIDTGDVTFTDQRIIFAGTNQAKEWDFANLLGFHHMDDPPWTLIAVSGQDKASGFRYDEGQADEIRFAMVLGLARFNNGVGSLVADLQEQLEEIDRAHGVTIGQAPMQSWQSQQPTAWPATQLATAGVAPSASPAPVSPSPALTWPAPTSEPGQPAPPQPDTQQGMSAHADPLTQPDQYGSPGAPDAASQNGETGALLEAAALSGPAGPAQDSGSSAAAGASAALGALPTGDPSAGDPSASTSAGDPSASTSAIAEATENAEPTGEIPAVTSTPTAAYPAVGSVRDTPMHPMQAVQPAQGQQFPGQQFPTAQQLQPQESRQQVQAASSTPPGWYPDPWRVARVRWWDGYAWTAYTSH